MMGDLVRRAFLERGATPLALDLGATRVSAIALGEGAPLVLAGALGQDSCAWARVLPGLARVGRAVALDPPELPPGVDAIEGAAGAIAALLDRLEGGPAVLAGSSAGGVAVLRAARERPDRVAGVVILGLSPSLESLAYLPEVFRLDSDDDVRRHLALAWARPPALSAAALAEIRESGCSDAFRRSLASVAARNVREEARAVRELGIPAVWIVGRQDGIVAAGLAGRPLAPPEEEVHVLEVCGHYPAQEKPGAAAERIRAHFEEFQGTRT